MPPDPQPTPRRPDAVRCPRDFPRDPRTDRDVARNRLFGPLLGVPRVYSVELTDRANESFVRPSPTHTLFHPYGHPLAKEHRYSWWIAGRRQGGELYPMAPEEGHDGEAGRIKLGYLLNDPYADDPEVQRNVRAEYDQRASEYERSPECLAKLRELGILPPEAQPDNPAAAPHPAAPMPSAPPVPAQSQEPEGEEMKP